VSKNMKIVSTTIRFRPALTMHRAFVDYFADTLPITTLGDLVAQCDIIDDPDPSTSVLEQDRWMVQTDIALGGGPVQPPSRYVVRLQLSSNALYARRTSVVDVRRLLRQRMRTRAHVVSSEVNDIEAVVRLRLYHVAEMVEHAAMTEERQAVLSHRVASVLLNTLVICGHPNITETQVRTESTHRHELVDEAHVQSIAEEELVVDATGASLADLAVVDCIDWNRCYSNDLYDVQTHLGISAASEALYHELREVISFDGTYIFPGHLLLIVDSMSRDGFLKPLNRFGVNRDHANPLARSSYEETPDILTEAAMYAEDSKAVGVSTSIILGQRADVGTGLVDARFASDMLPQAIAAHASMQSRIFKTSVRQPNRRPLQTAVEYTFDTMPRAAPAVPASVCEECIVPTAGDGDATASGFASVPREERQSFALHSPDVSEDEDEP